MRDDAMTFRRMISDEKGQDYKDDRKDEMQKRAANDSEAQRKDNVL